MKSRFKTVSTAFIVALLAACQHEGAQQNADGQASDAGQAEEEALDPSRLVTVEFRLDGMSIIRPPESNLYVDKGPDNGGVTAMLDMMDDRYIYRRFTLRVKDVCGKTFEVGGYKERGAPSGRTYTDWFSATLEGDCGTTYLCVLPNTFPYYEGCEHTETDTAVINTCPLICEKQ